MINLIIFTISFYLLLLSVIGYGILFQNLCLQKLDSLNNSKSIYLGFYGLFFITLISLITSLFIPHNFFHNILIHSLGIIFLIFIKVRDKKNYLKFISLISVLLFSALLISKGHDDLSYYHLPFTKYLTEQKIIFGMGHLNHGYNLLSSLFFLNSTFYLPLIEYYSFHFSALFFLIFFNFFILKEIFFNKNHEIINFLYIFSFSYFNLSFNRIAEYGTDKAGQLLIVILIIKLFAIISFNKNKIDNILYLIPLLAFCISLKTYFIPYVLLGLILFFLDKKLFKNLKIIFLSKSFVFFLLSLIIYFFHHFISTGCFISPLAFTCFGDNVFWGRDVNHIKGLAVWLEQWSKAGAGPNFRVDNLMEYIKGINWVGNWIEKYFLEKFLDQLAILFFSFVLIFVIFKKFELKKIKSILDKRILYFYSIILIIFFIWFFNHPTLRYGGYPIVFLTLSIPISFLFFVCSNKKYIERKFKFFVLFIIILFNLKNINRIDNEFNRNDMFKFVNFPFYTIKEKEFKKNEFDSGLIIYSAHHCWSTPTPCGHVDEKTRVYKKNGYFFINKIN